jgi:hypothetical protein
MLVGLALLAFQVANPFTPPPPAQVVNETRVVNEVHVIPQPLDPEAVAEATVQSNGATLNMVVAPPLVQWVNDLLSLPDIWRTTPPEWSYDNPAVRQISESTRNVAVGLLAAFILATGIAKALGQDPNLARPIYAVILSAGTLTWWEIGVRINNTICAMIGAPAPADFMRARLKLPTNAVDNVGDTLLMIAYAVVAIIVLGSLVFRLGMIMTLIPVGFLALMCKAVEQTDNLAQNYNRISVGLLFSQVLYVIAFRLVEVLGALGTTSVATTIIGMIILFNIRRAPGMLSSMSTSGSGTPGFLKRAITAAVTRRVR